MDTYRICPKCRSEYTLRAQNCADCGAILVWPASPSAMESHPSIPIMSDSWDDQPPGEILGQLAVDTQHVVEAYLGILRRAGIRGATVPQTEYRPEGDRVMYSPVFGTSLQSDKAGQIPVGTLDDGFIFLLFVRRADFERAEQIIAAAFADLHPGDEGGLNCEFEAGICPACQFPLPENATECPDCGLALA